MNSLLIVALLIASQAHAESTFILDGKQVSKLEATKALIANPNSNVQKACEVELTSKMTMKCKSKSK